MQPDRTIAGPRAGIRWFLAGYAGVAGFLLLEATVRQPGPASDLQASKEDAGSTRGIVTAYVLAALSAPAVRRLRVRPLPAVCAPLGLGVLAAGLALRMWSMQTLSEAYSRTLRVTNEQSVTDEGPYRHIRHPGYLGSLLIWSGFALSSGSLLDRDLPGYGDYRGHTKKRVPGLW